MAFIYIHTLKETWHKNQVSSSQLSCSSLSPLHRPSSSSTGFIFMDLAQDILIWSSRESPTYWNASLESCFTLLCCVFIPIIFFATSASSHFTSSHTSFGILSSVHFSHASNCSPIITVEPSPTYSKLFPKGWKNHFMHWKHESWTLKEAAGDLRHQQHLAEF